MLLSATAEGLGAVFHIPVGDEAARIKALVNAPEHYELTCLLTLGYMADNAFLPAPSESHRSSDAYPQGQLVALISEKAALRWRYRARCSCQGSPQNAL